MNEPRTLGELLAEETREWESDYWVSAYDLRRILYGTDEPCRPCGGLGYDPIRHVGCSACHGTGRTKTPGLVERWMLFLCYAAGVVGEDARAPDEFRPVLIGDVLEFLRREIGDNP